MPDLQQRQVLDSLARIAANPGDLPFFSLVYAGTMNVKDVGSFGESFKAIPHRFTEGDYSPSASREITGNWSLKPTNNPDQLTAIRCAAQIALFPDAPVNPSDLMVLGSFTKAKHPGIDPRFVIPRGWLCVGDRKPKSTEYWARCGHTYVWVKPGQTDGFSRFVLIVLDIVTQGGEPKPPGAVYGPGGMAPGRPQRIDDTLPFNPGLFFVNP